jgi:hypothetical protein
MGDPAVPAGAARQVLVAAMVESTASLGPVAQSAADPEAKGAVAELVAPA